MKLEAIKPGLKVQSRENHTVATVDHSDGDKYIKLKRLDTEDARHHWIPSNWVERSDNSAIYLSKSEEEFFAGRLDQNPAEV